MSEAEKVLRFLVDEIHAVSERLDRLEASLEKAKLGDIRAVRAQTATIESQIRRAAVRPKVRTRD